MNVRPKDEEKEARVLKKPEAEKGKGSAGLCTQLTKMLCDVLCCGMSTGTRCGLALIYGRWTLDLYVGLDCDKLWRTYLLILSVEFHTKQVFQCVKCLVVGSAKVSNVWKLPSVFISPCP